MDTTYSMTHGGKLTIVSYRKNYLEMTNYIKYNFT